MARLHVHLLALLIAGVVAPPATAKVLIGVAGPSDGTYATVGKDIRRAARLAAEHINAGGGIGGEPVEIVERDDNCAAKEAGEAASALVAQGVALVVGHPCAAAAVAAATAYAQSGIVFIAPATRNPAVTEPRAGPTVFRLAGRNDRQGTEAGAYIARNFASKPVAIVHDGSRFAKGLAAKATAALKAAGASDVLTVAVVGRQKDYTALIGKLRKAQTQAVYYTGYAIEGGQLLRQMRAAGLDAAFLGSDALTADPFAEAARDKAEGAKALLAHDASRGIAAVTLKTKFAGQPVTGPLVSAYAAIEAWTAAARQAHSTAGSAVGEVLAHGSFDTVLGHVSFNDKGDADLPAYDVVTWRDGVWRRED